MIYYTKSALFQSYLSKSSKSFNQNNLTDKNEAKINSIINNVSAGGNVFGGSA